MISIYLLPDLCFSLAEFSRIFSRSFERLADFAWSFARSFEWLADFALSFLGLADFADFADFEKVTKRDEPFCDCLSGSSNLIVCKHRSKTCEYFI